MKLRTQLVLSLIFLSMHKSPMYATITEFQKKWTEAQSICATASSMEDQKAASLYNHPFWLNARKDIKKFLMGQPNEKFLYNPVIQNAMVRRDVNAMQRYEEVFLKHCVSKETQQLLTNFKETLFGLLPLEITEFNCTVSSLGHLYSAAKILESSKHTSINTIVEFGAGFGNLARIFKMILPDSTLVLIDFPEMLALQYLYLSSSLNNVNIVLHTEPGQELTTGAIHLLPVFLLDSAHYEADCFVSTFALSESTEFLQKQVIEKKFFGASVCYLTGQISGWGSLNFVNEAALIQGTRHVFKEVLSEPFHYISTSFLTDLPSYEILARYQKESCLFNSTSN